MSKSKFKAMVTFFFAIHGVVYLSSVPEGQTMNEHYCLEVLAQLRKKYEKTILNVEEQVMGSSSALAHTALSVKTFLVKHNTPVFIHFILLTSHHVTCICYPRSNLH